MNQYHPDRDLWQWAYYVWIRVYLRTYGRVALWWMHRQEASK